MSGPIRSVRTVIGAIQGSQQRILISTVAGKHKRDPLSPERLASLRVILEQSFRKSEDELSKNYEKLVCPELDDDFPK